MLVLALEFSRGCAAHAWAGTLVRTHASHPAQERFPRPGHARGERSTDAGAAHEHAHTHRTQLGGEELTWARLGSEKRDVRPKLGHKRPARTSPGVDPLGRSLKTK
jgi:hypothetical protein